MKKSLFSFLILFSLVFISCEVGMGASPDLEAPVISITSMESGGTIVKGSEFGSAIYCKKGVIFKGEAKDNEKVKAVEIEIKWDGETDYSYFSKATLHGKEWVAALAFEKEGVASLKFTVSDYAKNISTKSSQVVTLFIDDTAPVGNAWYIDRKVNGIQYSLRSLSYLQGLNLDDSENKDAAQNVAFSIRGSFSDTMGIKNVYIELFDESGNKLCKINKTESSGLYAPEFLVSASDLSALDNNKHYIEVKYSAEDVVTVPESNKVERVQIPSGCFIWWPDSDKPRIVPSTAKSADGTIHLDIKSTLSLTIFDDDCLDTAYCALLTGSEYSDFTSQHPDWATNPESIKNATTSENRKGSFTSDAHNTTREVVKSLKAPDSPDITMHLIAYAKDIAYALDGTKNTPIVTTLDIPVQVTDTSKPKLFIETPLNNSIPELTMSNDESNATVTISGQTLDTTGCSYLEFVWVPSTVSDKYNEAKKWLDTLVTEDNHNALSQNGNVKVTTKDGMKLWSVPLSTPSADGSFIKNTFSFSVDIFNDFVNPSNNKNEKKEDKYFLVKLTRLDFTNQKDDGTIDNFIYSEYTLKKDNTPPEIHVDAPSYDMQTIKNDEDYTLSFYASKASNLPIDTTKYKIEQIQGTTAIPVSGSYNSSTKRYEARISQSDLTNFSDAGIKPKYRFTAEDIFEISNAAQYTLIISTLPALTEISSTSPDTRRTNQTVDIAVAFSKTIDVASSERSKLKLKIKGITNTTNADLSKRKTASSAVEIPYDTGSGSTTLHFKYTVDEGDLCTSGITLYDSSPLVTTGVTSLAEDKVIIGGFENYFDSVGIKVDGINPAIKTNGITVSAEGTTSDNIDSGVTYLSEGKTLTVTVQTTEKITIQGSPKFKFANGIELPYAGQTDSTSSSTITFSRRIKNTDGNGTLSYKLSDCITGYSDIVDEYGNSLKLDETATNPVLTSYFVDTEDPEKPSIMNAAGTAALTGGNKPSAVSFTIVTNPNDATIKTKQYSINGGNKWEDYSAATSINSSVQLTARTIDYAGNISPSADILNININNSFPSYTLECTNPAGSHSAGTTIKLKLSFGAKVKIKENSTINLYLTGKAGDVFDSGNNYVEAELKSTNADENGWFTTANFEYKVKKGDQFTLCVASGSAANSGLHIANLEDEYTHTGSGLTDAYETEVVCDGVIPYIKSMTPDGETEAGSNVYNNGREITIVFNEPVQKGTGNITLRLVKKWAIPPVIKGTDFNTILNAIPSDWKVNTKVKNVDTDLTGKQILCMDEAEDVQDLKSGIKHKNDYYHGTGQYIGPYKKSSYGINDDGTPKTGLSYVLDVNMGIWETTTAHYYGTTYAAAGNSATPVTLTANNATTITADNIRNTLEAAGYHERVLDVTSGEYVKEIDSKTYTIEFPKGLTGDDALPDGREWELVIEKGAFVDYTGKEFGSKYSSNVATNYTTTKTATDSIMEKGGTLTDTLGTWASAGRGRTSVTGTAKQVVLIQTTNGENSFWSNNVATPVIRIDRYSYGVGIKQSDASGTVTNAITANDTASVSKPTGYVRVRIDCETDDVEINYTKSSHNNSRNDTANTDAEYNSAAEPKVLESSNTHCYSYITSTTAPTNLDSITLVSTYEKDSFFAAGNGDYTKSCKDYIVAQATKNGFTTTQFAASELGKECAFQTVVRFYRPNGNTNENGVTYSAGLANGHTDFSIRGTTYWGGEPALVPYPLRDSRPGSCYLRRCYRDNTNGNYDYYWISYEILVESSFSGYSCHTGGYYDWCKNWGYMHPGEFTICVNMKNWD